MKKRLLILVLCLCQLVGLAQPVIDGVISPGEYALVAPYLSGNNGIVGTDMGAIYYAYRTGCTTCTPSEPTIYIGITGKFNVASPNFDNIVLFLDFSNYIGRNTLTMAGSTTSSLGVFKTSGGLSSCTNGGLAGAKMDIGFDADYAFAFNTGGGPSFLFCDVMRFSAWNSNPFGYFEQGFLGNTPNQSGGTVNLDFPFIGANGCNAACQIKTMRLAFDRNFNGTTNTTSGIEFSIPVAALPGVAEGDYVKFFAVVTNVDGLMSNETIPGNPGSSNLGCNPDFSSISGQQFYTALWLLPFNFLQFEAKAEKKGILLNWNVSGNNEIAKFEIERSTDGQIFSKMQSLLPGSNRETESYSYIDESVNAGSYFYRISAMDSKGKSAKSQTVRVQFQPQTGKPSLYPNPIINNQLNLNCKGLLKGNHQVQVINMDGRVILKQAFFHDGNRSIYPVDLPVSLPVGMYWLRIEGEQQQPTYLKFLK